MGRMQRNKGAVGERATAKAMARVFPDARRGIVQCRDGGEASDVIGAEPFWVENKVGKKTNIKAALRQAIAACGDKPLWPIAVCRDDNEAATVTMTLEDWLDLVGEWRALSMRAQ
jgi:uncharacterized membrane protein